MSGFKKYRRTQIAEMRPVTEDDVIMFIGQNELYTQTETGTVTIVSIYTTDRHKGSPKIGDMIARNPKNHSDQWLVEEQDFKDNFEPYSEGT
jgi:hypothetical protein